MTAVLTISMGAGMAGLAVLQPIRAPIDSFCLLHPPRIINGVPHGVKSCRRLDPHHHSRPTTNPLDSERRRTGNCAHFHLLLDERACHYQLVVQSQSDGPKGLEAWSRTPVLRCREEHIWDKIEGPIREFSCNDGTLKSV